MKTLFIPYSNGVIPHLIPLISLESKLNKFNHETAFLLPGVFHKMAKSINLNVIDVDHFPGPGALRSETLAYNKFKPDIVVDDGSISTLFVTQLMKIPRVAIQRTGIFPYSIPRNKKHVHSQEKNKRKNKGTGELLSQKMYL